MKFRKKPIVVEAARWFKNGDHPRDYDNGEVGHENGEIVTFSSEYRRENKWEGGVVRYFRSPDFPGQSQCPKCGQIFHDHGFIDTAQGGHRVCPGDWILTDPMSNDTWPIKPDILAATYEEVVE